MIKRSEVEHVARLARLNLTEDELESYTRQLGSIINYINNLNQINTENVEPTAHVLPISNVFREDEAKKSLQSELVLKSAPEKEGRYFKTPKIFNS